MSTNPSATSPAKPIKKKSSGLSRHKDPSSIDTDEGYYSDELKTEKETRSPPRRSKSNRSSRSSHTLADGNKSSEKSTSSRSERASRSQSVSSTARKKVGKRGKSTEISTLSRRASRTVKTATDESPGLLGTCGDERSETQRASNRRSKSADLHHVGELSFSGIEIRVDGESGDDDSTGPLASIDTKKVRKITRKQSSKDKDDDETASRGSVGTLKKKKSSKKKADCASAGDSLSMLTPIKKSTKAKKSDGELDLADRSVRVKQTRTVARAAHSDVLNDVQEHAATLVETKWENEEYLLSPKAGKQTFDDSYGSEAWQGKRSARSIMSDLSSQKRSYVTAPTDLECSFTTEGDAHAKDLLEKLNKQLEKQVIENADLKKSLAIATEKIASLSENLCIQGEESRRAQNKADDLMIELKSISSLNETLHKSLVAVEKQLLTKDESLTQLVEGKKISSAETQGRKDEATLMDHCVKFDDSKKGDEVDSSVKQDSTAALRRVTRLDYIKAQLQERMSSKAITPAGKSDDQSSRDQRSLDLVAWERRLEENERQLEVERERHEAHGKRLDDRERALDAREKSASEKYEMVMLACDSKDALISDLKAECADLIAEKEELAESALERIREKQAEVATLQKKLGVITEEFEERNARELLGKDAAIRQLEEELIATRAVIEAKTSDQFSMEMKAQIKSLGDQVRTLTKRLKEQQVKSRSALNEKDHALTKTQRELTKLQREVDRLEEKEKIRVAMVSNGASEDSKLFIDELEDEIRHWKQVNHDLEDELEHFKREANELKSKLAEDDELDDDASIGSLTSHLSRQSMQRPRASLIGHLDGALGLSQQSLSSLSKGDTFFVAPTKGSGEGFDASVDASGLEHESSSQRALRSVSSLWSKITLNPVQAPAGLYQKSFDD
jgi:hypothetical protein